MCAMTAAQRGRRVLVLERSKQVGRKILMSGGGRCNFTNLYVEPDNFLCSNRHFVKSALKRYTQWDFISLVEKHGIPYHERRHGQLFCNDSAKDIVTLLLAECEAVGVTIKTRCEITAVEPLSDASESRYCIQSNQGAMAAVSVVVATGGLSIPSMGSTGFAYELATSLGLALEPIRAGLVPLTFTDNTKGLTERLSGNALDMRVSVDKRAFQENVLFTHRGLSGPAILQISNYWQEGSQVHLDLFPDETMEPWLLDAKNTKPKALMRSLLGQRLPKILVQELEPLWWPDLAERILAEWPDKRLGQLAAHCHRWSLKPSGTEGYRTAEVTLGGVSVDALSSKNMMAKAHPGLYFIGEGVDVTGHLGGFNFQWAWSSGYAAGSDA